MQKQKKKESEQTASTLQQEYERIKNTSSKNVAEEKQKIKNTRVVTLRCNYKACCGCGCYTQMIRVKRTVAYDSPLKDGDYIDQEDIISTDEIIW